MLVVFEFSLKVTHPFLCVSCRNMQVKVTVCVCVRVGMCFTTRSEELRQCQAATVEQMERYEAKHLGGFKRIYPREGGEKYDKYFKHSSSLFQETAASKAREECARYLQQAVNTQSSKEQRLFMMNKDIFCVAYIQLLPAEK